DDGKLRNAQGVAFEFEYLDDIGRAGKIEATWRRNLEKLGITMNRREIDYALMVKRIEAYDFDITQVRTTDYTLPKVGDLRDQFGSHAADAPGADNYSGVKSPVVDHLLDVLAHAQTMQQLLDGCHALDRVIMNGFYAVPDLYSGAYRVSYWDRFGIPAALPKYYTIDSGLDIWPAWAVSTWWFPNGKRP
ncbi:MAG: ABC transporter substrate-binding protein, partial [Betaproteobacteria bacterium]